MSANCVWPRQRHACLSGFHVRCVPHKRRRAGSRAVSGAVGDCFGYVCKTHWALLAVEIHAPRLRRCAIGLSSHRSVATAVTGEPQLAAFGPHLPFLLFVGTLGHRTSDMCLCSLLFSSLRLSLPFGSARSIPWRVRAFV